MKCIRYAPGIARAAALLALSVNAGCTGLEYGTFLGGALITGLFLGLPEPPADAPAAGDQPADGGADTAVDGVAPVPNTGAAGADDEMGTEPTPSELTAVLSEIDVDVQGRVACGDGIIAFTAPAFGGVPFGPAYIHTDDGEFQGVPEADRFEPNAFVVAGAKIVLVQTGVGSNEARAVSVFDTQTLMTTDIPAAQVRLQDVPLGNYDPGHMQADGGFVAVQNDARLGLGVTDTRKIKVLDLTGDTPVVISFTVNPDGASDDTEQVMIDAETRTVVAVRADVFYVYDIDAPAAPPTEFDLSATIGIEDDRQFAYDDGLILFHERTADRTVYLLDATDADASPVAINGPPATGANARFAIRDGAYAYLYEGPAGQGNAAAVAVLPSLATVLDAGPTIAADTPSEGRFSYGDSLAIGLLAGQPTFFIGGVNDVSDADPLQASDGADWVIFEDPAGGGTLRVADVVTNADGTCLAFKHEANGETRLGYVLLAGESR